MNILTISGSAAPNSKNKALLSYLPNLLPEHQVKTADYLHQLPLFIDNNLEETAVVKQWKNDLQWADGVIIATPEYLYNIPALLKNALEWVTKSGELLHKRVLPIVYTPVEPRGEYAIQSLIFSLKALDTTILTTLHLYHTDLTFSEFNKLEDNGGVALLKEAIKLLASQ